MPTTLPGALLFVFLLLPGFAYQVGRERRGNERTTSVLRELSLVVVVSVVSQLLVFIAMSWLWSHYIDFGRLVREPREYWLSQPSTLGWWGMGLLFTASLGAYLFTQLRGAEIPGWGHRVATVLKWFSFGKKKHSRRPAFTLVRWLWRHFTYTHSSALSAWAVVFQETKLSKVVLDIRLTDGAWVSGSLMSYSSMGADTPDRDLILGPPIRIRGAKGKLLHPYPASNLIISARQISAIFVSRLSSDQDVDAERPPAVSHPPQAAAEEEVPPQQ